MCEKGFELHLQSESEHALTDPFTSLCCLGFPLHLFCGAQFLRRDQRRPSVGALVRHSGTFCFFPVCAGGFLQVAGSAGRFSPCVSLSLFFTAVGHSRVLEHATAISVVSVAGADCFRLGDREGKPSRGACLVVQRSVQSPSVRSQHPEASTLCLTFVTAS